MVFNKKKVCIQLKQYKIYQHFTLARSVRKRANIKPLVGIEILTLRARNNIFAFDIR